MDSQAFQNFLENNITDLFSYLGAIQGFILSIIVLFYPKRHRVSNRLLFLFLLIFSHLLIATRITEAVGSDYVFLIYGIRFFANIALLLYIRSLFEHIKWSRQWWHLIVIAADNFVIYNRVTRDPILFQGMALELFTVGWYLLISGLYLFLIINAYQQYKKKVYSNFSSLHDIGLKFVYQIIVGIIALMIIDALYALVYFGFTGTTYTYHRVAKTLCYTAFMYFIAIKGKLTPQIFQLRRIEDPPTMDKEPVQEEESELLKLVAEKVMHIMEKEKLYMEEGLTVKEVADKIDERPYVVSQAINTCLGKNFFELVNGYRVEESKNLMLDEKLSHLSMIGIAFEAGFSSKTAFNTAFKKHTGLTPSQFKKESIVSS